MERHVPLSLSSVEHAAILRHLKMRRGLLFSADDDCGVFDGVLGKLEMAMTIAVTRSEVHCMIRYLRAQRERICEDQHTLEERRRVTYSPRLDGAWRSLDADGMILDDVLRRLWSLTS